MIGGAAVGAFLISNDIGGVKHTIKDMGKVFKGPKWKPRRLSRSFVPVVFADPHRAVPIRSRLNSISRTPKNSSLFFRLSQDPVRQRSRRSDLRHDAFGRNEHYDDPHQVEEVLEKTDGGEFPSRHALEPLRCKPSRTGFRHLGLLLPFWV